ncbi:hypothetical protein [Chitinimonas koreensis]|uniref:hypothetical protein n=1 Tax=Chitinimonas koreensis TaxID=356302 RepID=UPI0012F882B3|nr:hypothetical protein [Chitinimonas koreensis]QNM97605.1 hypothetical protein H9L41_04710 [Chitinimonas koreensis]
MNLRVLIHLESPYAQYIPVNESPEHVLLAGLGSQTDYWASLAINWLEQGAPMSYAVAKELKALSARTAYAQSLRHRAFALARRFELSEPIQELNVVRIVQLLDSNRSYEGTAGICRAPHAGDTGAVVHVYPQSDDSSIFAVEMADEHGYTIWLADFVREELCIESKHISS